MCFILMACIIGFNVHMSLNGSDYVFLPSDANIMLRNEVGMTALHFASRGGHIQAATELLASKAGVHAGTSNRTFF